MRQPIPKPGPKPKKHYRLKHKGKVSLQWDKDRALWVRRNPPDYRGMYRCCFGDGEVHVSEVSIEHRENRGSHPERRGDQDNMAPAHGICNMYKRPMMASIS